MAETDPPVGADVEALRIRASMGKRVGEATEEGLVDVSRSNAARQSAHGVGAQVV